MSRVHDVAVIGAGPYGLGVAAELAEMDVRVFGRPMSFWRDHMPKGMLLRSPRGASSLAGSGRSLRLEDFEREEGVAPERPLPLSTFVRYGGWFRSRAVPGVDPRSVSTVEPGEDSFEIVLEDGEPVRARRVIVAAGIEPFAWRPPEFAGIAADRCSHTVDHDDLSSFAGRRVAVIGAGQSAIESAALLRECGAEPEVVARVPAVNWLVRSGALHRLRFLRPLLYGPSDIGPAGLSWLVEWPKVFGRIPRDRQDRWAARAIRPAASAWLVPRVPGIPLSLGRRVRSARSNGQEVALDLDDGTTRRVDHVLLATGYRVDVTRYGFLSRAIRDQLATVGGFPRLHGAFESSLPGLHFVGAPAAWTFGPLFRFVAGVPYAARELRRAGLESAPTSAGRSAASAAVRT